MHERIAAFVNGKTGMGSLVPDYYLMYAAAIVLGTYLAVRDAERKALNPVSVFRAGLVIVTAAMVGARLFVVAQYWGYYRLHLADIPKVWDGGTASTGAYIGGLVAAFGAAKWYRLPMARFFDCCAPAVAMAIVLGRIGCFLNGCCYGSISELPWAVCFPPGAGPYHDHLTQGLITVGQNSLSVHPTQLYEALYGLVIFGVLASYRRIQERDGEIVALLFFLYPAGRFFNEFLRADERGAIGMLSIPQVLALVLMALSAVYFLTARVQIAARRKPLSRAAEEGQMQV